MRLYISYSYLHVLCIGIKFKSLLMSDICIQSPVSSHVEVVTSLSCVKCDMWPEWHILSHITALTLVLLFEIIPPLNTAWIFTVPPQVTFVVSGVCQLQFLMSTDSQLSASFMVNCLFRHCVTVRELSGTGWIKVARTILLFEISCGR